MNLALDLFKNSLHTGFNALSGLLLAMFVVLILGFTITLFPRLRKFVEYTAIFAKVSPAIAYVPLFIAWFGLNSLPKILTVALISFYPMMIEIVKAKERYPDRLKAQCDLYAVSEWQRVINMGGWAYMLDGICRGLLTGAPLAVIGAIVGDYVGGGTRPGGLGVMVIANQYNQPVLIATIACCTLLGFMFFGVASKAYASVVRKLMLSKG